MEHYSHVAQALAPDADRFDGTVNTDVFGLSKFRRIRFVIALGAGDTGTTLVKVQACDDFTPSDTVDVAARYRIAGAGDVFGAWTPLTTAGLTIGGSASNKTIEIDLQDDELPDGYPNVRLNFVEANNSPVDGGVVAVMLNPRYDSAPPLTAIA